MEFEELIPRLLKSAASIDSKSGNSIPIVDPVNGVPFAFLLRIDLV